MDDLDYGTRDKRGNWAPREAAMLAPVWDWPPAIGSILRWLPGYVLPFNILWAALAVAYWGLLVPDVDAMRTLSWDWPLVLLAANAAIVLVIYGSLELRLYVLRAQGGRFKYNARFPADNRADIFWFRSQNIDNALRSLCIGVPVWTALQTLALWGFANGAGHWLTLSGNPVYLAVLALLVPVIHETHFYLVHRLIHTPFLYKWVHSVHHKSNNPSPWSSLSMHPVEHLLYFSSVFYHLLIPSNPVIALYQINFAGFGAFVGHVGFHKIEAGSGRGFDTHAYIHHLHHKYFEVNYGDGLVPFDRWFGTFHDGSAEGEARMQARFAARRARMKQGRAGGDAAP